MSISLGAINRAVIQDGRDILPARRDEGRLERLGEIEQQIHVVIDGDAGTSIDWATVDITFDVDFVDGTGQRYSNLAVPTFTHGAMIDSVDGPVLVTSCVTVYARDDRGVIVGATVAVGALSGTADVVSFTGHADLSWQGFGSLPNEPADPDFTP